MLAALARKEQNSEVAIQAGVIDVTQVEQMGVVGRVPSIRVGEATINDLDVTFGDFPIFKTWDLQDVPALIIGMDMLGTLQGMNIDYQRKEVALLPRSNPSLIDRKWFSLGSW